MKRINKTGLLGEVYAVRYMRDNGYEIVATNYRTRLGEIDIIAENKKFLCFVEVKTRGEKSIAEPKEWVDLNKQKKIISTAKLFLMNNKSDKQPRFDVFEIWLDEKNNVKKHNYIKNAFETED